MSSNDDLETYVRYTIKPPLALAHHFTISSVMVSHHVFYILRGGRLGTGGRKDTGNALVHMGFVQRAHLIQLVLLFEKRLDMRRERRVRAAVSGHW